MARELSCSKARGILFRLSDLDLPGPGIEPMSPALAGRFLTTGPPGMSQKMVLEVRQGDELAPWTEHPHRGLQGLGSEHN